MAGYCLRRWRLEEFFRVPGSGCGIEALAFRTANRLHRAIVINAVTRWRTMPMTRLGRQVPACGAVLTSSEHELLFLDNHAKQCGPAPPDGLGAGIARVADLGGCRAREHDSGPGDQIVWHGSDRLANTTPGHRTAIETCRINVAGGM